jgi:hypothetical protein
MKRIIIALLLISPCALYGQIGIKAGLNFANVTKTSSINNSSRSGFHASVFLAPPSKGIITSRTELMFSRQGYNYKTNTNTGVVNLEGHQHHEICTRTGGSTNGLSYQCKSR